MTALDSPLSDFPSPAHVGSAVSVDSAPFIVRVAGLPATAIEPFAGETCIASLCRVFKVEKQLTVARNAMVESLYHAINGAPTQLRRFLLKVKRDSHNGRRLARHCEHPLWGELLQIDAKIVTRLLTLEQRHSTELAALVEAYHQQQEAERRHLVRLVENRPFMRGVALGSSSTVAQSKLLAQKPIRQWGRRERRLELTLARYISRAALKLSPFSTLTRTGLGLADPNLPDSACTLAGGRSERCFLRLRRYIVEQNCSMLLRYLPFRRQLPIVLNRTFESLGEDRYRFVKPGYWDRKSQGYGLELKKPALVRTTVRGAVFAWLREYLKDAPVAWAEAVAALVEELAELEADTETVERILDQLIDSGILTLVPPWCEDDPYLESRLLAALEEHAGKDPELVRLCGLVRRLIAGQESYATAADPACAVGEAEHCSAEIWRVSAPLGGLDPELRLDKRESRYFNEDVFLVGEGRTGEIVRIGKASLERALHDLEPIARLSNLVQRRHDFLLTLAAAAAKRWPAKRQVPLMDFFEEMQPLFRHYIRYVAESRHQSRLLTPAFNPLELATVTRLERARREVGEGLYNAVETEGDEMVVSRKGLEALLEAVPGAAADLEPFTAILQPFSHRHSHDSGGSWVLNSFFEGSGHHSSRYSVVMSPTQQEVWTEHYMRRAFVKYGGEACELIAILCPAGNNVNLHIRQTPRLLALGEDASRLSAQHLLCVRDIRVKLRGTQRLPVLVDTAGQRLLPVHLGGLVFRFLPNLFKFLLVFGRGKLAALLPNKGQRQQQGDVEVYPRHRIGQVVFSRRNWSFEPARLLDEVRLLGQEDTFLALNRWRHLHGIPKQVFLREPLEDGVLHPQSKPQYIDFSSPVFVRLFRTALEFDVPKLWIAEASPGPEALPTWADGERRAVELQVDLMAIRAEGKADDLDGPIT